MSRERSEAANAFENVEVGPKSTGRENALSKNQKLEYLDITGHKVGYPCVKPLTETLLNMKLKTLFIDDNHITFQGLVELSEMLVFKCSLTVSPIPKNDAIEMAKEPDFGKITELIDYCVKRAILVEKNHKQKEELRIKIRTSKGQKRIKQVLDKSKSRNMWQDTQVILPNSSPKREVTLIGVPNGLTRTNK